MYNSHENRFFVSLQTHLNVLVQQWLFFIIGFAFVRIIAWFKTISTKL